MQQDRRKTMPNPFYQIAILAGFSFVVTILASVAILFGNEQAPAARLFNQYVNLLLIIEVVIALSCGLAGMACDSGPVSDSPQVEPPASEPLQEPSHNPDHPHNADTEQDAT